MTLINFIYEKNIDTMIPIVVKRKYNTKQYDARCLLKGSETLTPRSCCTKNTIITGILRNFP